MKITKKELKEVIKEELKKEGLNKIKEGISTVDPKIADYIYTRFQDKADDDRTAERYAEVLGSTIAQVFHNAERSGIVLEKSNLFGACIRGIKNNS